MELINFGLSWNEWRWTEVSTYATIAGCYHPIRMSPQKSHFADINLLGADFCNAFKFRALYLGNGKVKFLFKDRWNGKL